jgi:plastocyanin
MSTGRSTRGHETGDSFSYTFDEPGDFEHFCQPHPWMRARIGVDG